MARTIRKDEDRSRLMKKYDEILKEIAELPAGFGKVEILDENRAKLNTANLRQKFSKDDHLIICIGRTHGSAGNDIDLHWQMHLGSTTMMQKSSMKY